MGKIKVTPTMSGYRGAVKAPYYVIVTDSAMNKNDQIEAAVHEAKSYSRLSEFPKWVFFAEILKR